MKYTVERVYTPDDVKQDRVRAEVTFETDETDITKLAVLAVKASDAADGRAKTDEEILAEFEENFILEELAEQDPAKWVEFTTIGNNGEWCFSIYPTNEQEKEETNAADRQSSEKYGF